MNLLFLAYSLFFYPGRKFRICLATWEYEGEMMEGRNPPGSES